MSWSSVKSLNLHSVSSKIIDCQMLRVKGKAMNADLDADMLKRLCETVKKLDKEVIVLKNRVAKLELLKLGKKRKDNNNV